MKSNASKKRHAYTVTFKAMVINAFEESENVWQDDFAEQFRINQSMVSRWLKDRHTIMKDAASVHRKLFKKGRKSTKYVELYERLWKTFKDARARGIPVNFHWLWSKACVIQSELDEKQPIKKHVIVRFLQKYQIRMRAKQRNKKKSKSQKVSELEKWHATYREKCIQTNFEDPSYDEKLGNFKPDERINVDQSPLPFVVNSKKTYEFIPPGEGASHNTWISQPGSGLDKRQCSLQVAFRYKGEQPRLAVIFRGKGKRITQNENLPWHPNTHVYFRSNAWMDSNVNMQWTEKTLKSFVEQQKLKKYVLLLNNLEAHCTEEFKVAVRDQKGLVWYGFSRRSRLVATCRHWLCTSFKNSNQQKAPGLAR